MNIVDEIREKQKQLIIMVNSTFEEIIQEIEKQKMVEKVENTEYEISYPITNTTGFKGRKPIAVKFENHRVITPTWRVVIETILKEVIKDKEMESRVLNLRDVLLGRVRKRISGTSDGMRKPLELKKDLFIETHYDTETLMNLLLQILNEISYDYKNISIIIKN